MTRIIAHRGFSERFSENTLLAYREALKQGADCLEMDVHCTADSKLMLHHYYALGETDDGDDLTFLRDSAYLRSLDAGSWKAASFKGERIPYLEDVLAQIGNVTAYEIDFKGFDEDFLSQVLDLVRKYGILASVEHTSPLVLLLQRTKDLDPTIRVGMFSTSVVADWMPVELQQKKILASARLGNFEVVHCPIDMLTPRVRFARPCGGTAGTCGRLQDENGPGASLRNRCRSALDRSSCFRSRDSRRTRLGISARFYAIIQRFLRALDETALERYPLTTVGCGS